MDWLPSASGRHARSRSAAAITGNPQNILIGSVSGIGFARFVAALGPVSLAGLTLDALLLWVMFRRDLQHSGAAASTVQTAPVHAAVLWKTLVVMSLVVAGFLAGYDTSLVAAAGAAALLVTRRVRPRKVYAAID